MRTILLTGGTGFLGSCILRQLTDRGFHVVLIKRSFSNTWRIKEYLPKIIVYDIDRIDPEVIFKENSIDMIIHCATEYGRESPSPLRVVTTNIILPLTLLELGAKYKINCFINTDTILDKRIGSYSLSKKQFNEWLEVYRQKFTCVNIVLEQFYGPGDNPRKFVTRVVHDLLKNVEKIDLTKGDQKRDFIYIDDVVDAFVKIVEASDTFSSDFCEYEIGTNHTVSVREFVELAKTVSGNTHTILNFGAIPYRDNELMDHKPDLSKISRLGWKSTIPLKEGLKKMVDAEKKIVGCDLS